MSITKPIKRMQKLRAAGARAYSTNADNRIHYRDGFTDGWAAREAVIDREMMNEKIYRILRDYQDGKFTDGCGAVQGCLDQPLTVVSDKITAAFMTVTR